MVFPLRESIVSIGRGPDNTIQIIDSHMSRRHTLLIYNNRQWLVRDLGSKNGTLHNGESVEGDQLLQNGDQLLVGDTTFSFENPAPTPRGADTTSNVRMLDDKGQITPNQVMKMRQELGDEDDLTGVISSVRTDDATLNLLYQVSDMMSSLLDLGVLLDRILELIERFLSPDRVSVLLYDEQHQVLMPRMVRRRDSANQEELVISNSIIDCAVREHLAVLVGDAPSDVRFKASESIVVQRIHSAICAPLLDKNEVLGVVYLDRRSAVGRYQEKDLKLVTIIANQAAMALANSRLHTNLLRQRAHERDFEIARNIQENLLPLRCPEMPGFEAHGVSEPARMVGGDYFDLIPIDNDRVVLAIADVSGKGVPAAILLSAVRTAVQIEVRNWSGSSLLPVVNRLNQMVCRDTSTSIFVTMVLGVLNTRERTFSFCNAGHVQPILCHANGQVERLEASGCFLGILPGAEYEQAEVALEPGSLLALYSDGVTDLANERQEIFGQGRLIDLLRQNQHQSVEQITRIIQDRTNSFSGSTEPFDDFTLLLVRSFADEHE